jgi:hypothetical protein
VCIEERRSRLILQALALSPHLQFLPLLRGSFVPKAIAIGFYGCLLFRCSTIIIAASAGKMSKQAATKPVHVQVADDGHHTAGKVKKVLTTKYNMEQLKKITEFDSWVDEELEKLSGGKITLEIDFEEWDSAEPGQRKAYLESKLGPVGDTPARRKFVDDYSKRAASLLSIIHDPSLKRTASGTKLH